MSQKDKWKRECETLVTLDALGHLKPQCNGRNRASPATLQRQDVDSIRVLRSCILIKILIILHNQPLRVGRRPSP